MKFEFGWCELCKTAFIYCPKCGNNGCNGGSGELNGEVCDVCDLAHQYQQLAWETKTVPSKQWIEKHPADILEKKSWFKLESERLRKHYDMSKKEKIRVPTCEEADKDGCWWEGKRVRERHEWYMNGIGKAYCRQCGVKAVLKANAKNCRRGQAK